MKKIINRSCLPEVAATENKRQIDRTSPELLFMEAVLAGDKEKAAGFFEQEKLFGGQPAVDAPFGRFEGKKNIEKFAGEFLSVFQAQQANMTPIVQTRANGRSISEVVIDFEKEGAVHQTAMFVVGELRTRTKLEEVRLYCHFTHIPGATGYRRPIFCSAHLEAGDPGLLTGAVREYYEALHHMPAVDPVRILKTMQPGCKFGGYEPVGRQEYVATNHSDLKKTYEFMATYIPRWVSMRYETITDDGINCVIEWQHIVSDDGRKEGERVALAGISSYERGEDGLLCSIRISDYAGYERQIDWNIAGITKEEAFSINAVSVMPGTVGRKKL